MFDLRAYLAGLAVLTVAGLITWLVSIAKRDVSIVDSVWGPMFAMVAICYSLTAQIGPRSTLALSLVVIWALRLAVYITWRNWGEPEDYRYREIRRNNEPFFAVKSVVIVFGLQAALAWIISLPLLAAVSGQRPVGVLDFVGIALWLVGMLFETVGDWQLARFKAKPENDGAVLDRGLWRYTRHPNYFGEFCIWWGFYCLAAAAGGWWSIVSPLLMTFLLLKVSGVSLLEKDISARRPAYASYVRRTSAFLPLPRRKLAPRSGPAAFGM